MGGFVESELKGDAIELGYTSLRALALLGCGDFDGFRWFFLSGFDMF